MEVETECAAAAAAKSLQLCLSLCDPIDGSPPGSPVPGILQARTLEWVASSFSTAWKVKVKSLSHAKSWLIGKDSDAGRDWKQEEKGTTEDEMAGWHHCRWTWVWVNSGSWWWTGRPGVLRFMGLQRVGHDWATELNWTEYNSIIWQVGWACKCGTVPGCLGNMAWKRRLLGIKTQLASHLQENAVNSPPRYRAVDRFWSSGLGAATSGKKWWEHVAKAWPIALKPLPVSPADPLCLLVVVGVSVNFTQMEVPTNHSHRFPVKMYSKSPAALLLVTDNCYQAVIIFTWILLNLQIPALFLCNWNNT